MSIDPQPLEQETIRESFWSIDKKDRLNFSFLFSFFFILGLAVVCWYYICHKNNGFTLTAFVWIAKAFVPTGLFVFTLTFLIFEMIDAYARVKLTLQRYSRKRKEKQLEKGRQEVLDWLSEEHPDIDHPFR